MKKVLKIAVILTILMLCSVTVANAATNEDVIAYLSKSFNVNGTSVSLSAADKVKARRYFEQHPVSAEDGDRIIAKVDEGVALMRKEKVTDYKKLSKEKKQELLNIAQQAAKIAGAELTYDAKSGSISIYKDGVLVDQITAGNALVQTGSDNSYIVYALAGVAVIAIAGFVVYNKKGKVNA